NSGEWDAEVIYHKGKLFSIVISATRKFKTKTIKDNTLFKFPNYPKTGAVRYKGEKKFEIINRNL
ncbi:hypothetical protein JXB01_01320, partial [Candidatus Micrarchaeota archaeon]|nr:hypothetical protein [Candidatus Micrarchaeota archaeon]